MDDLAEQPVVFRRWHRIQKCRTDPLIVEKHGSEVGESVTRSSTDLIDGVFKLTQVSNDNSSE